MARILVVEDDLPIQEIIVSALGYEGYSVDVVEDGAQAWDYLLSHDPDLVVLDLALPRMDGITLCRKLRANPPTRLLPVLVVSASGGESVVRSALDAGASAFLDKPFDLGDLVEQVLNLVRPPRASGVVA